MTDPSDVVESVLIAVAGCAMSLLMSRIGGETMDRIVTGFVKVGMYEIPTIWQHTFQSTLINLFYIVCMLPACMGIVIGFLRSQKKTEYDTAQYQFEPGRFE